MLRASAQTHVSGFVPVGQRLPARASCPGRPDRLLPPVSSNPDTLCVSVTDVRMAKSLRTTEVRERLNQRRPGGAGGPGPFPAPVLSQAVHGSPAPELLSEEHVRWPASLWLLAVSEASVPSKPWAQMRSTVQQNATTLSGAQGSLKWERWCRDPKVT